MNDVLLPIGSVCKLKNTDKCIMIIGYCPYDPESNEIHDYCGCMWPLGMMNSKSSFVFNHDNIDTVVSLGFSNDEERKFRDTLISAITNKKMISIKYDKDTNNYKVEENASNASTTSVDNTNNTSNTEPDEFSNIETIDFGEF